jgi:carbamoyltransferase
MTLDYLYKNHVSAEEIDFAVLYQKSVYGYLWLKATGFKPIQYGYYLDPIFAARGLRQKVLQTEIGWNLRRVKMAKTERNAKLRQEAHAYFAGALRLPAEKVTYIDHHLSHAYSTLPNVQHWPRALIFTLDGQGDGICGTVNLYKNGKITVLSRNDHRNSLGYYYAATTAILGMKAGEHEFKVMGLAPYAKRSYYERIAAELKNLLIVNAKGEWESVPNPEKLFRELGRVYRFQRFDNIAGAIQNLTEERIVEWIAHWIKKTDCHDVAVAGGVFMNVKASQKVLAMPEVDQLFVMPSAADESCPIGCAAWANMNHNGSVPVEPLADLYLGMCFDDTAIEKTICETKASERYSIRKTENIDREIAIMLAENKIVARCTGRMEWGARALGNRSILANPSDPRNVQKINDAIKSRDFWMPFTPSILDTDMSRYVQNHNRIFSPYMCITFESTTAAREDLIAAIHPKDFTVRPQCVTRDWNRSYYDIISTFKERTGIGAILNTSFNLHGEPNVCSPRDAIHTVDNSDLEYLALGSFLLKKDSGADTRRSDR